MTDPAKSTSSDISQSTSEATSDSTQSESEPEDSSSTFADDDNTTEFVPDDSEVTSVTDRTTESSTAAATTTTTAPRFAKPVFSAQVSATLFNNRLSGTLTKIPSQKVEIYPFNPNRGFNHSVVLAAFKGKIYAMWQNGYKNEDDCGARVLISSSADGLTWTKPWPIMETKMGVYSELVQFPLDFYTDGKTLYAYNCAFEYTKECLSAPNTRPMSDEEIRLLDGRKVTVRTTTDGVNWTAPQSVPIPQFTKMFTSSSGRLLASSTGGTITYTNTPATYNNWGSAYLDRTVYDHIWNTVGNGYLGEPGIYETKERVLRMYFRTRASILYISESYDNGESWTNPYKTNFTDNSNRAHFGTLPDGRNYYVGTPDPGGEFRFPLKLCVSEDGYNFDKQYIIRDELTVLRQDGFAKTGHYGYPYAVTMNGYLFVGYSKMKETIEVTRIPLSEIR